MPQLTPNTCGYLWEDDQTVGELSIKRMRQAIEKADLHNLTHTKKMSQLASWYGDHIALDDRQLPFPKVIGDEEFEWKLGERHTPRSHIRRKRYKSAKRYSKSKRTTAFPRNNANTEKHTPRQV